MNKVFNKAFEETVGIEGGYVNDPLDSGGETKFGITKTQYPNLDIKDLTIEKAKEIYKEDYWDIRRLRLDNVAHYSNDKIAIELFDTAVNLGQPTAANILQESLNLLNRNEEDFDDLIVDGFIGPKCLTALEKVNLGALLKTLNGIQFCRYKEQVEHKPEKEKWFNGWLRRV